MSHDRSTCTDCRAFAARFLGVYLDALATLGCDWAPSPIGIVRASECADPHELHTLVCSPLAAHAYVVGTGPAGWRFLQLDRATGLVSALPRV